MEVEAQLTRCSLPHVKTLAEYKRRVGSIVKVVVNGRRLCVFCMRTFG
jgi:hypothetical protein